MHLPSRKTPARQPVFDNSNRSNIIFVTVCTAQRNPILASEQVHQVLLKSWNAADHWAIGRYMIMPDHVHLFCSPAKPNFLPIKRWIAYWKSLSSKTWPNAQDPPIWQSDAWDRQLRKSESYHAKWQYIRHNPVKASLCETPDDWPFQGELNTLFWHD